MKRDEFGHLQAGPVAKRNSEEVRGTRGELVLAG